MIVLRRRSAGRYAAGRAPAPRHEAVHHALGSAPGRERLTYILLNKPSFSVQPQDPALVGWVRSRRPAHAVGSSSKRPLEDSHQVPWAVSTRMRVTCPSAQPHDDP